MVKEYLEIYQDELLKKKLDLEKRCYDLEIKVRENIKFILYLEKEKQNEYDSFTPRKYDKKKDEQIQALKAQQEVFEKEAEKVAYEISDINGRLAELSSIIKVAKQNEMMSRNINSVVNNNDFIRLKYLETQELERQRIARDIHDSVIQSITGVIYKTELCTKLMDMDIDKCKVELGNISKMLHGVIGELREVIYDLRPMSYDDIGLDISVERELSRLNKYANINVHYKINGNLNNIKPVISLSILRIIQEACNNIIKHSDAKNVNVIFTRKEKELILTIEDDGKGFDMENEYSVAKDDNSGFGLSMMRERVFFLSGHLDISSEVKKGTKILVKVPLGY